MNLYNLNDILTFLLFTTVMLGHLLNVSYHTQSIFNTPTITTKPQRAGRRKQKQINIHTGHRPNPVYRPPRPPQTLTFIQPKKVNLWQAMDPIKPDQLITINRPNNQAILKIDSKHVTEQSEHSQPPHKPSPPPTQSTIPTTQFNSDHYRPPSIVNIEPSKCAQTNGRSVYNKTIVKRKKDTETACANDHRPYNLKIMNINCRSLISDDKRIKLEQLIETHKPDVILATETHIDSDIDSKTIFNDEYLDPPPYRKDRKLGEGGVLIATKYNLISIEKETNADCEVKWTRVSLKEGYIFVGSFYRQPSSGLHALEQLRNSLRTLCEKKRNPNILLAGDFNLPDINWDTLEMKTSPQYGKELYNTMIEIMDEFNLIQVVHEPTRGKNILDLVFTTHPDLVETPEVLPGMSDHQLVLCNVKTKLKMRSYKPGTLLLYNKGDFDSIKKDLKDKIEEFNNQSPHQSVNENWLQFKKIISDSIEKNIPRKSKGRKQHVPWITKEIKRLIRRKQRRYNVAKRHNKMNDWRVYRELRAEIHEKLRKEHLKYICSLLEIESEADPNEPDSNNAKITKRFWSYIKSKRKERSGISVLHGKDGSEATDAQEKANILNEQYKSVFTNEDPNKPILENLPISSVPKIIITDNGIIKQLQDLDANKATGPDEIPARVLKETAIEIAPYLANIFQQSIDTGTVPDDWTRANVTAIFKKGKRDDPSNYRPVSLTSIACKVLEHVIFHNIIHHLDRHNILVDYQHGFRKNRSCETQLLSTIEDITKSNDNKKQVDLIVLDFSKAFDTVAHRRLLYKLEHVGIRNISHLESCDDQSCEGKCEQNLLKWFESWLCYRTQQVILEGQTSDSCKVTSGVPQGTVLGPLCFLIYINDIGNELSPQTKLKLFADDSLIYRDIENVNDTNILQRDLDSLIKWTEKWQMHFHPSKCEVMNITSKKTKIDHQYQMLGQPLQNVKTIKYLGVHIQNDLKWERHVNSVKIKANRSLGFIKRNLYQCPQGVKAQAYKALIRPSLEYASAAWDPHLKKHISVLENVQRKAARFVTNCRSRETGCVTQAIKDLGWRSLETRRKNARLTQMYRIINDNQAAVKMPTYYAPQSQRYSTRSHHKQKCIIPHARTDTYKRSFFPQTILDWNSLPSEIIDCGSLAHFKRLINVFVQ